MRVIEKSPWLHEIWRHEYVCPSCEAVLEVEIDDVLISYYDDQFEGETWTCSTTCPECGNPFYIVSKDIPKKLLAYEHKKRMISGITKSFMESS